MKKYYEAYNERYKILHKQDKQCFSDHPTPILYQIINKYNINHKDKILDLGCGEARDTIQLLKQGYNVIGMDISKEVIQYNQHRYNHYKDSFIQCDCINGEYSDYYDFIYAIALLHMFVLDTDRNKFYKFLYNHLQSDGLALICTMGDGIYEYQSDIHKAYHIIEKDYNGISIKVPMTSCRIISRDTFKKELNQYFDIVEISDTSIKDEFDHMIYAVVKRKG